MRNAKLLGTALLAILALSAVAATMASADEFHSEKELTTLTAKQESGVGGVNILKTTAGSAECKTATFHATVNKKTTTTITATPIYKECTCIGIVCTVNMNECDYLLHITPANVQTQGSADLVCPGVKEVTLESAKCIIHIKPQTDLTTITYTNSGVPGGNTREITLDLNITNIAYSHTKVGEGIGSCTSGTGTTGSLTGKVEVTGEEDSGPNHVGIWVE